MFPSIKAIFFDLGDTLVRIKLEILQEICERLGQIRNKPLEINEYMDAFLKEWSNRSKPLDRQLIKEVTTDDEEIRYWKNFFESLLPTLDVRSFDPGLVEWLASTYSSSKSFECFEDVHTVLAQLKLLGYKLGLISNAFPSASRIMKDLGLSKYFNYILLSFEFEFVKPEPEIYHFAVEQLDVELDKAVFVDDRARFVNAALQVGMNAYLIERFPNPNERVVTKSLAPKINDLHDLRNRLSGSGRMEMTGSSFLRNGFDRVIEVQANAMQ